MSSPHVTLDFEALRSQVASIVVKVAKSRPAVIAGENSWFRARRINGILLVIEIDEAGGYVYIGNEDRVDFLVNVERREADQSNEQHDEDVIMTDAPPIQPAEGGIVFTKIYSGGIESLTRELNELTIAPHRTFCVENTQVGETSEDVQMANSDW
ncbi:hypothetical protein CABS01_13150 [Colletotrichum abscissum]|uniref:uncharacterized protein n=1 Tax=Colletotrichum abscissum TaxID=1671311 RepID=UPI0027D65E01|nr:uncharacterized protein CABS01_13150 [Colletotrichum abscissum]KAK1486522.1 hypothetical protein CABS01_13150 [Colletotrichum abscissum]